MLKYKIPQIVTLTQQNGNILKKKKRINSLLSTIYPLFLYPDPGSNRDGSESTGV